MTYEDWLSQFTDWRPQFGYWNQFSFIEWQGPEQIQRLYNAFFEDSKTDSRRLTELVMTLNHKIWQMSQNPYYKSICDTYSKLWVYASRYAETHMRGDELSYYLSVID